MLCNQQWQDLRFDVQLNGTSLLEDSLPGAVTAPAPVPAAGGGAAGPDPAGVPAAGGGGLPVAGSGVVAVPEQARAARSGCAAAPGSAYHAAHTIFWVLALALVQVSYRRRRRCPR
jgi:hypothetical protein